MSDGTFLVLGIDGATFGVIKPNLGRLRNFEKLLQIGKSREIILNETPISASIWCGMFSGKTSEEHRHKSYVVDGRIVRREDIDVEFIWDILHREGKDVRALNVPFVVPPYSFRTDYSPVGFGLPSNEKEWEEELEKVTEHTGRLLRERPNVLVSVYTLLDRVQHFHWGEDCVVDWYQKVDEKIEEILVETGFLNDSRNRLIVVSDHGFCSFGEAKVMTLPEETEYGKLKGDHSEKAMVIMVNSDYEVHKPQDVFYAVMKSV